MEPSSREINVHTNPLKVIIFSIFVMNLIGYVQNMRSNKMLSLQVLSFWLCTIFMAAGSFSDESDMYFLMLEEETKEDFSSPYAMNESDDTVDTDPDTWRPKDFYSGPIFYKFNNVHSSIFVKVSKGVSLIKTIDSSILTNAP